MIDLPVVLERQPDQRLKVGALQLFGQLFDSDESW